MILSETGPVESSHPRKPRRKKRPPLRASLLSRLTFRSGRNGGPAPGGSKTDHPEAGKFR